MHAAGERDRVSGIVSASGILDTIGNTPLVRLSRLPGSHTRHQIWLKLEGSNPGGSVKDRPAYSMVRRALARGAVKPGDTLIEATSGNTGIALAMVAPLLGLRMVLVMPENLSIERRQTMAAYGAQIVLIDREAGMEGARDLAQKMQAEGQGLILDQFANPDNALAHYESTGPEIWRDTAGRVTHFVSSMGTTGTVMGVGRHLKEQNPAVQIVGVQPSEGSSIPGIRAWSPGYVPALCDFSRIDQLLEVTQCEAETMTRRLAAEEGIFAGVSSGGALAAALRLSAKLDAAGQREALIVSIVCDRGDRYLSTPVFHLPEPDAVSA